MTLAAAAQPTVLAYAGNGVSTLFPVPFPFFGADELLVIERAAASGAETVRTLGAHYTVSGGNGAPGAVTALSPPPAGVEWVIRRKTLRQQLLDLVDGDRMPAQSLERALDRLMAVAQELEELQGRALRFAPGDSTAALPSAVLPGRAARAGRLLGFDALGQVVLLDPQGLVTDPPPPPPPPPPDSFTGGTAFVWGPDSFKGGSSFGRGNDAWRSL